MNRPWILLLLAGTLPLLAVHLAWWLNLPTLSVADCNPYAHGCMSVSAAARSGQGIHLFRALVLPSAALLGLGWLLVREWLVAMYACSVHRARVIGLLGLLGALFLVLYAAWLGTDGDLYRWLRRQGVIFFFGMTGIAQLLLAWVLWSGRQTPLEGRLGTLVYAFTAIIAMQWFIGVASAFKDLYVPDRATADALGNLFEWYFLWTLSAATIVIGLMMRRCGFRLAPRTD